MRQKRRRKSKLSDQMEKSLIASAKRMGPVKRLKAFVEHSRLMAKMHAAGKAYRATHSSSAS